MEILQKLLLEMAANKVVELVAIAVVMDTIFGAGRAIKQHKFNSSVGIDGAIRKISMLVSLVLLALVDRIIHINLIGFIPEAVRKYMPHDISNIGLAEFFGLLYICYEIVSILKNMTLCGLPVKKLWQTVRKFLGKYTEELPSEEKEKEVVAYITDNVPEGALEENPDGTLKIYDEHGNVVGSISKEKADELASAVTTVITEE